MASFPSPSLHTSRKPAALGAPTAGPLPHCSFSASHTASLPSVPHWLILLSTLVLGLGLPSHTHSLRCRSGSSPHCLQASLLDEQRVPNLNLESISPGTIPAGTLSHLVIRVRNLGEMPPLTCGSLRRLLQSISNTHKALSLEPQANSLLSPRKDTTSAV